MSRRASTHKDPSEGIRQALGKHIKILLKTSVKLEKGGDKTDNRILVLTPHRMFVMTAKVPSKIDQHYHYLDIQAEMRPLASYWLTSQKRASDWPCDSCQSFLDMSINMILVYCCQNLVTSSSHL